MAYSSADVPSAFDVWINDTGYIFARDTDSSYFSRHTIYGQTPTFVERSNVSGNYGDDQQAFYMNLSQHDWSQGEGQRYIDISNASSESKCWKLVGGDPFSIPGEISCLASGSWNVGTTSQPMAMAVSANPVSASTPTKIWIADLTHLYYYDPDAGNFNDMGAHGASTASNGGFYGMIAYRDSSGHEIVLFQKRKYDFNTTTFSNFLDTDPGAMAFVNNVLYGWDGQVLRSYTGSGVSTAIYTFKDEDANTSTTLYGGGAIVGFGGKVLFLSPTRLDSRRTELYSYDGTSTKIEMQLPPGAVAYSLAESGGFLYIGGAFCSPSPSSRNLFSYRPAVWRWDGSSYELVWQASSSGSQAANFGAICGNATVSAWENGVVFPDFVSGRLMYLDVSGYSVALDSNNGEPPHFSSGGIGDDRTVSLITTGCGFIATATEARWNVSSQTSNFGSFNRVAVNNGFCLQTSLFDAGSSLEKYWKSVTVYADLPSGATMDLYYQLDGVTGSYTSFATNVTSGTEVALGVSAHAVSIQVVIDTSGSSSTARLHRVFIKGVPIQDTFRRITYVLDMSGNKLADPPNYVTLKNGRSYDLDGDEMRAKLITAMQSAVPITVKDRIGSFTGIIEPETVQIEEVRSDYGRGEYKAWVTVREV